MKKNVVMMMVVMLLWTSAFAFNGQSWATANYGTYNVYEGVMGKNTPIKMSLFMLENSKDLKGSYLYTKFEKEILLAGSQDEKGLLSLTETDAKGKEGGRFVGEMNNDKGSYSGFFTTVEGKQLPFKLTLTHATVAEYGHRYAVMGVKNDAQTTALVIAVKQAIAKDQKAELAKLVAYPTYMKVNGHNKKIGHPETFIKYYNQIITPSLKKAILSTEPHYLFVRSEGIMFGSGSKNIWLSTDAKGQKLLILGINN